MVHTLLRRVCGAGLTLAAILAITVMACGEGSAPKSTATGAPRRMIIETTHGTITCELYPDKAPMTIDIISELAEGTREWTHPGTGEKMTNTPYYDGIIFHRVIPNFMIQTGDPLGKGIGGPGFSFNDEFSPDLTFDKSGLLGMANSGPNTNGGQFFITVGPTPHLTGAHTIFGRVIEGQDVADAISRVDRDARDKPLETVAIKTVRIERE